MPIINTGDVQCFTLSDIYSKRVISAVDHERDEPKYKCKKGWIITSDKDGNYTPFFVNVRSKDIVWDQSSITSVLRKFYGKDNFDIVEMRTFLPGVTENFKINGWDINVNLGTRLIQFKKEISIAESFDFVKSNDLSEIHYFLTLPVPIISDADFLVSHTINGKNKQVNLSMINVETVETDQSSLTRMAYHIDIKLTNLFYLFHDNFKNMTEYKESFIYLDITGRNRYIK